MLLMEVDIAGATFALIHVNFIDGSYKDTAIFNIILLMEVNTAGAPFCINSCSIYGQK